MCTPEHLKLAKTRQSYLKCLFPCNKLAGCFLRPWPGWPVLGSVPTQFLAQSTHYAHLANHVLYSELSLRTIHWTSTQHNCNIYLVYSCHPLTNCSIRGGGGGRGLGYGQVSGQAPDGGLSQPGLCLNDPARSISLNRWATESHPAETLLQGYPGQPDHRTLS